MQKLEGMLLKEAGYDAAWNALKGLQEPETEFIKNLISQFRTKKVRACIQYIIHDHIHSHQRISRLISRGLMQILLSSFPV
jgi:hypothetical protein